MEAADKSDCTSRAAEVKVSSVPDGLDKVLKDKPQQSCNGGRWKEERRGGDVLRDALAIKVTARRFHGNGAEGHTWRGVEVRGVEGETLLKTASHTLHCSCESVQARKADHYNLV